MRTTIVESIFSSSMFGNKRKNNNFEGAIARSVCILRREYVSLPVIYVTKGEKEIKIGLGN